MTVNTQMSQILADRPMSATTQLARSAGGLPVRVRHGRRGSVIVLVVGVLALLAIVVLVYTSLGQTDRRASAALVSKVRTDDVTRSAGEYIAQKIGTGSINTYYQQPGYNTANIPYATTLVRQSWTYPSTDYELVSSPISVVPGGGGGGPALSAREFELRRFNPSGGIAGLWTANDNPNRNLADPRRASDPYLAAIEPSWRNAFNVWGNSTSGAVEYPGVGASGFAKMYRYHRDWNHISNVAPDGRYVNLAWLRGNFNVPSGIGAGTNTYGLTLLPAQSMAQIDSNATPLTRGSSQAQIMANGGAADLNKPAHWSTYQLGMARLAKDTRYAAGDPRNLLNQWCDTDGDGILDARWQELVDASVLANNLIPTNLLPSASGARYFIAARVVDLSGMANVNVGMDMEQPALANDLASNVIGLTPADFNLQSVLTYEDAYAFWGFGPETFGQPLAVNSAGNTSKYDRQASGESDPANTNGLRAGQAGFASILDARLKGAPAGRGETFVVNQIDPAFRGQQPSSDAAGTNAAANFIFPTGTGPNAPMNSESRELMYRLSAKDPFGGTVRKAAGAGNTLFYGLANPFGMPDEKELRTFWTASDPGSTSRLESAVDGRFLASQSYCPLMSNRGLDASRDVRTAVTGVLQNPHAGLMAAELAAGWLDQGIATRQLLTDARHQLTTYSGSRPLKQWDITGAASTNLSINEVRIDINTLVDAALSDTAQPIDRVTAIGSLVSIGTRTLAPFSNLRDSWVPTNLRSRSLAYGGVRTLVDSGGAEKDWEGCAPELAIRAGAHWAVNLLSMRDSGDNPIAYTVRFDGSSAGLTAINGAVDPQNQQQFFFGMNPLTSTVNNTLKLWGPTSNLIDTVTQQPERSAIPLAYLSNTTTNPAGRGPNDATAINVFSITPQPFITQVSSFVMYGDRRADAGSDGQGVEWVLDPVVPQGARPDRVTIDPKVDVANGDFAIEIVAFQITNPFNKTINLSSTTVANGAALPDADFRYYLEFAGRNYKIAEFDALNGNTARAVELQPGQTRTFYIIPQNPSFYTARFGGIDGNITSDAETATLIQGFVNSQLSSGTGPTATNPVRIVAFDAQNGTPAAFNAADVGILYPQSSAAAANPPADINHVARLWRTIRVDNETAINSVYNDQLVDRIRDPHPTSQQASLNRRLAPGGGPGGVIAVAGSRAGPDPVEVTAYPGVSLGTLDNTGFSICYAGSFRRPDNPGTIEMGVLPAYCIEAKSTLAELPTTDPYARRQRQGGSSLNISESAIPTATLDRADFGGTVNATTFSVGNTTLKNLLQTGLVIIPSTKVNPDVRNGSPIRDADGGFNRDGTTPNRKFLERPIQLYVTPITATTGTNPEKAPPLRPADLLMALGVGPYQEPLAQLSGTTDRFDRRNIDVQWTTLSEALALALDYDSAASEKHVEWNIGGPDSPAQNGVDRKVCSAFDRGHLRIDAFTLFNDVNGNGKFDQSNAPDPIIGRGIPAALGLLDEFRTTPWGSATSSVFGQVNINTATRAVGASISPLLSPIAGSWATIGTDPIYDTTTTPAQANDIVGTLLAYRDKTLGYSRPYADNSGTRIPADFHDGNDPNLGTNVDHANIYTASGRRKATQIIGIREQPGFQSIGEIMAATIARDAEFFPNISGGTALTDAQRDDVSIDRYERLYKKLDPRPDGADGSVGISSMLYLPTAAAAGTPRHPSPAKGLYEHKLAIANSVLSTLSTRSDVFCVYFVLNGYLPGDVEGLAAFDTDQQGYMAGGFSDNPANTPVVAPMVPSIQRRFMMIVDRSNVVTAGDKPRILMFEELPMK